MWTILGDWATRFGLVSGLALPLYGAMNYLQLTPATQAYVTEQVTGLRKEITVGRADILDTRRTVLHLYRNDLIRERQAVEGALAKETNVLSKSTWGRRLETINTEIERIDRQVQRLDDQIEEMRNK